MYIIMCVLCWGSERTRKAGKGWGGWGRGGGTTDSCRVILFFLLSSSEISLSIFFPSFACMSLAVYIIGGAKVSFNLYLSFSAAKFAYTIKLRNCCLSKIIYCEMNLVLFVVAFFLLFFFVNFFIRFMIGRLCGARRFSASSHRDGTSDIRND